MPAMDETLVSLDCIHGAVSVVGSMNADYTVTTERLPKPGETVLGGPLRVLPGGKSGNQAVSAARLGAKVRLFGVLGSDANADFLLEALNDTGVDTSYIRHVDGASGTTVITVDAAGENTIVYSPGSNAYVSVEYIQSMRDNLTSADVLGLCLESPMETVTACARLCMMPGSRYCSTIRHSLLNYPLNLSRLRTFCWSMNMKWHSCWTSPSLTMTIGMDWTGLMWRGRCMTSALIRR